MHLNTHFMFYTFHLSTRYFTILLLCSFKKKKKIRLNECSQKRTEALTLNGYVSTAKLLMDDANYHELVRPHKGSGSICDVLCFPHSWMLDDDIHLKYGTRQEFIVRLGWCWGLGGRQPRVFSSFIFNVQRIKEDTECF